MPPCPLLACAARLSEAVDPLLRRAAQDGAVAPDVTVADLVTLVTGIGLAMGHHPDPAGEADRLLALTVAGISPKRPERGRGRIDMRLRRAGATATTVPQTTDDT